MQPSRIKNGTVTIQAIDMIQMKSMSLLLSRDIEIVKRYIKKEWVLELIGLVVSSTLLQLLSIQQE